MRANLIITKESDPQWRVEYQCTKDAVTIGRDPNNDVQLLEGLKSGVSRQHAKIKLIDGTYKLVDLSSRNFTFLNDRKLEAGVECDLLDGDRIKIGEFSILFSAGSAEVERGEVSSAGPAEENNVFLDEARELAAILERIGNTYKNRDPH